MCCHPTTHPTQVQMHIHEIEMVDAFNVTNNKTMLGQTMLIEATSSVTSSYFTAFLNRKLI